ncbi:MAG TPA: hypothetical protein VK787_12185 [Puia sp.]|jgi:hypothetical protein|nr:hypothetical protein [Puia sp.]
MLNLSDNELDDLSREAAEKFEPAGNAQSWNKLEQLLDKNLGTPKPIPKTIRPGTIFMYSGAILIAASLTYFLTKSKKNNQNSTPQISTIINKKQEIRNKAQETRDKEQDANDKAQGSRDKEQGASNKAKGSSDTEQEARIKAQEASNKIQEANDNAKSVTDKSGSNNNKEENTNRTKENSAEKDISNSSSKGKNNKININADKLLNGNSSSENNLVQNNAKQKDFGFSGNKHHRRNTIADEKNKNGDGIMSKENTTGSNSSTADLQNDELRFAAIPGLEPVTELYFLISDSALRSFKSTNKLAAIVNLGKHRTHGAFIDQSLQVGILFAPEFSEVKHIYENNRIGNNFGVTLSYQLSSKISINSGFIFSKKYYQSNDESFHAPKGAVDTSVDIKFVNGSANVIDIPLNIRYNYFSDENSIFFVNAGFSSYLMSKQNVSLYCQPKNNYVSNLSLQYPAQGRWIPPSPSTPPENKSYLFSVLNLSAGFETSLGNNFSFQFEPYVKLPVKGIGYGKVNMTSYGVNFSLKYAPVLKRGRRL